MRASLASAALAALAGCSAQSTAGVQTDAECTPRLRLDGVVYEGVGHTDRNAAKFSRAEQAECRDTGPTPGGSVFSDDQDQVTVWSFAGHASDEVLGVRFDRDSFSIFVADSVPRQDIARIVQELSSPEG